MTILEAIAIIANHSFPDQRSADAAQMLIRRASQAAPAPSALVKALRTAEAALSDIGDAEREEGDDLAWCEGRAAKALPLIRPVLRAALITTPAPSDALREVQEECDCCVDGLQADGETPCPYCTKPAIPVADAAEALLEAHKSGAWLVGKGRTLEQVAMIIAALRAALSTPTEERQ